MESKEAKLVYTPKDIQKMLSLSKSAVYNLIRDGSIPSVKIGHSYRISVVKFDQWCKENKIDKMC
jgi:excisionase family DNA binding protein|nr:MAG TPA: helix-turn-helix domain protein [Caudoviricetes sp.]